MNMRKKTTTTKYRNNFPLQKYTYKKNIIISKKQ